MDYSNIDSFDRKAAESQPGRQLLPAGITETTVVERLDQSLPLDAVFRNDRGEMVRLGSLFTGDRPMIISLNYSNCPKLCLLQLNGLVDSLRGVELVAGKDYGLISVSLHPGESPEQAAATKQRYLDSYGKTAEPSGWHFLVGTKTNIDQVAQSLGIEYVYVPERKEYSHPAVFCLCTPDGRISRYHYGIEFPPHTLRLSLVEAGEGKIGTAFDRFLMLCFHYDNLTGRYTPVAKDLMKMGGLLMIISLGSLYWYCQWRMRRQRQIASAESTAPPVGQAV